MNVSADLMKEHQLILRFVDLLGKYINAGNAASGKAALLEKAEDFIDFIRNFADSFHHAKEEDILFKHMSNDEVLTHCNPLPQMLLEHDQGREYVKGMADAVQEEDVQALKESANAYGMLLQNHIYKEDNILYPMAENGLQDSDKLKIGEEYQRVETEMEVESVWSKYETMYADLKSFLEKLKD